MVSTSSLQFNIKVVIKIIEIHGALNDKASSLNFMNFDFSPYLFRHRFPQRFPLRVFKGPQTSHPTVFIQQDCHLSLGIAQFFLTKSSTKIVSGTKVDLVRFSSNNIVKTVHKAPLRRLFGMNDSNHIVFIPIINW